jgi:hypothetical protein
MAFRARLRDPCTRDVARLSESVKILERRRVYFPLPESRATSQVHGSRYPAWKTIWYIFYKITIDILRISRKSCEDILFPRAG